MMTEAQRKRIMNRKWKSLRERGITPPRDEAEKIKRLKEAHGGS